jgi:hypothetical protein
MRDGAKEGFSATGILVGADHAGKLHIDDCQMWHFPSKGVYGSSPGSQIGAGGTVHVNGGLYKNNNDCDVRIGSPGSTVRNIISIKDASTTGDTVTWKDPIPRRYSGDRRDIIQTRSIRLKNGRDVLVEGCEFRHEVGGGVGVVTVEGSHGGGTTIQDCRIEVADVSINPVSVRGGAGAVTLRNLNITGNAGGRTAIMVGAGRSGTTIENCRIDLTEGDGIRLIEAEGIELSEPRLTVPDSDVVFGPNQETPSPSDTQQSPIHSIQLRVNGDELITYRVRVTEGIGSRDADADLTFEVDSAEAQLQSGTELIEFLGDIIDLELPAPAIAILNA